MNAKNLLLLFVLALISCSRSYQKTSHTPSIYKYESERKTITASLFSSEDRTISEADIKRLLDGEVVLPETVRIAIFNYSNTSSRYYSYAWQNEEYLKLQQTYIDIIEKEVSNSKKVKKVILMPSIMRPRNANIVQLREASVRLQADLLLIFSINSDIYYNDKLFKKDEAKAFATCEALLMDVRTGMIPHSDVMTEESFARKEEQDLTNQEMRKRAEQVASSKALQNIATNITQFLDQK